MSCRTLSRGLPLLLSWATQKITHSVGFAFRNLLTAGRMCWRGRHTVAAFQMDGRTDLNRCQLMRARRPLMATSGLRSVLDSQSPQLPTLAVSTASTSVLLEKLSTNPTDTFQVPPRIGGGRPEDKRPDEGS